VHAGHSLAWHESVTLADAARMSWVIATPGSAYHQLTLAACLADSFTPDMVHQTDEWETGAAIVARAESHVRPTVKSPARPPQPGVDRDASPPRAVNPRLPAS
jgi:hypothetical protein